MVGHFLHSKSELKKASFDRLRELICLEILEFPALPPRAEVENKNYHYALAQSQF